MRRKETNEIKSINTTLYRAKSNHSAVWILTLHRIIGYPVRHMSSVYISMTILQMSIDIG